MNEVKPVKKDCCGMVLCGLIAIILFAGFFMFRMTCILESHSCPTAKTVVPVTSAGCTNQVVVSSAAVDEPRKPQDNSSAFMAAYGALSNELSTWMSIMGIFAAIFGLVISFGAYLLQRQSLKDERESISKELEKVTGFGGQINKAVERLTDAEERLKMVEDAVDGTSAKFWKAMGRCFEYSVITNKYAREYVRVHEYAEIANLILSMELSFDCRVLARDKKGLDEQIKNANMIMESLRRSHYDNLAAAYDLLRSDRQQRTPLVEGIRYLEMLGSDNELYRWLKEFFDRFDATKLP